mmetsp:Transcript_17150/g.36834  ORF Transcript_17150/g.36834 Transcript_17150/m.36834 type:complete len:515 (-) Transcript_17150:204-1748(-)|eukprot:CAMPEP_0206466118 /NCGR_PEP_ID=MMETSP0324_2-20121206/28261_1 /ASSEMBLY_ACC=CAM_ASM_000836 /TAXON_ID=2866 /ORGANISM="Crypthecodinium cohnii, Strain Seligo" /LENGTH=514 /DNA_ID=CAMNT_0053939159 /DNA_START=315 /DNA_END=1859 /DNA_ORIENTATION=+
MAAELRAVAGELRTFDRARQFCSKNKKRFQESGYDLDLSYITPRIIAMGFPSTGWEAIYRNPLKQVQRFLAERHEGFFKVYNLCSERDYDLKGTFPIIERFPFDDHNPCPMSMLIAIIDSITAWLGADERNVVAVHCKAGKGRTGMVISALLLHLGLCASAADALHTFAERRTQNAKGVTIPSQRRYVQYYESLVCGAGGIAGVLSSVPLVVPEKEIQLRGIRLSTIPFFTTIAGSTKCSPYFKVFINDPPPCGDIHQAFNLRQLFCYREAVQRKGEDLKTFDLGQRHVYLDCSDHDLRMSGEVLIKCYASHHLQKSERMFQVWFNTGFLRDGHRVIQFSRSRIDGVAKDKKCKYFPLDFGVQLFLNSVGGDGDPPGNVVVHEEHFGAQTSGPGMSGMEFSALPSRDSTIRSLDGTESDEDVDPEFDHDEAKTAGKPMRPNYHKSSTTDSTHHHDNELAEQQDMEVRRATSLKEQLIPRTCKGPMCPEAANRIVQQVRGESSSGIEDLSSESDN